MISFKRYSDLCDVVSLLPYCPGEKAYLLAKDSNGEFWLASNKSDKACWKGTAQKINFDLFGSEAEPCLPLRINKVWVPDHQQQCLYHAVYKVLVKPDLKKKTKIKQQGIRSRLQWYTASELERQKAHGLLRSPEVMIYAQLVLGDYSRDSDLEIDTSPLIEICEENVLVLANGGGAVSATGPHLQLLQGAGYTKEDQLRLYREFIQSVFPALYMSGALFTQFMMEVGFERGQGPSLFRSADVSGRGGLSFAELALWCAALEPATPHAGHAADLRCRYIFRYFDSNRDLKLENSEFKELVGAARAVRQQTTDGFSVARDVENILKALGLQANSALPLAEFLRAVSEMRLRGTSMLLRAPKPIGAYLLDAQNNNSSSSATYTLPAAHQATTSKAPPGSSESARCQVSEVASRSSARGVLEQQRRSRLQPDYSVAAYTVRLAPRAPPDLLRLAHFDEEAVSVSAACLASGPAPSVEMLSPGAAPAEALAAVRLFAAPLPGAGGGGAVGAGAGAGRKAAWSWRGAAEEARLGALLLRLAEAARPLVAAEPRVLRPASPVYIVGDLHGNLSALLAMEAALWPTGPALAPARLLFLGDYVDRGPHGAELLAYLLAAKLQRPAGVLLLRGNHETRDIQKMFTFYNECVTKYGETEGGRVWSAINNVFDVLPLAAVVDDKVFCCHGGIPPPWVCPLVSAIEKVPSPLPRPAEQSSVAWELLWNDPIKQNRITASLAIELAANEGFAANSKRGTGHVFDQSALDRFLLANQLSHVVRAHEMHQLGFMCQLRGRLVSVFSSSHYCGGNNDSGVAMLEGGKLRLIRLIGEY